MARCGPDPADFHPASSEKAWRREVVAHLADGLPEDYLPGDPAEQRWD